MIAAAEGNFLDLSDTTWAMLLPRPKINSFEWICEKIVMPNGAPFDPDAYPWTRGICEAWDDPRNKVLWLQFAARLGKTALAHSLMLCSLSNDPSDGLYGTSTQDLAKQTVRLKYLPMMRNTDPIRHWVPPEHKILQTRLDLKHFTLYVSWSGSPTTLADIGPKYKHGGEIDKWDRTDAEADSLDLFGERGIEHRDGKTIYESTPTLKGKSRVATGVSNGSDCRLYVPCRKCGHYQMLVTGSNKGGEGGLVYDQPADGTPDPELARRSARYQCEACGFEHADEHKRPMIKQCIWAPRGTRPNKSGELEGKPNYDGPNASYQLGRIYAPTFTFGDIAAAEVDAEHCPERRQNYDNSWRGEVHEIRIADEKWDDVSTRLTGTHDLGIAPENCLFISRGVDVQIDHMVYWTAAWGSQIDAYCLDYGIVYEWSEIQSLLDRRYDLGGGLHSSAVVTLIDSRYRGSEVMEVCTSFSKRLRWVLPCAGSTGDISGKMYRRTPIDASTKKPNASAKRKVPDVEHITVNTPMTQNWVRWCLTERRPGQRNSLCMPSQAVDDEDFWTQMLNEQPDLSGGRTRYASARYVVIDESIPVDLRDAVRYARTAAEWYTRGKWNRLVRPTAQEGTNRDTPPPPPERPKPDPKPDKEETAQERRPWVRSMRRRR